MSSQLNIGMIGVGMMGHGIAKNILAKGYSLTIMGHRNRKQVDDLLGKGAKEVTTPAELTKVSDVIILCVTGTPEVEEIVLGHNGIIEECREGLIIIDCSTAIPVSTLKISEQITARGGVFVDAPMSRTPKEAEEGRLNIMVGADDSTLAKVKPVMEAFTENIFHIGPVGSGHKIKLINNFLGLGHAIITAEAAVMARENDVDLRKLFEVVSSGGANSAMFEMCMPWLLEGDDSRAKFTVTNALKDLTYLSQMVEGQKINYKMLETVRRSYAGANEHGFGDNFLPRLADAITAEHGVEKKS
jgi:3-hydroxyisobutyrate dehydrogenase-like beta-hydroxyacid dehydrogenase